MTGVEIAGVGLHPFGRFGQTPATALGVAAARAALADAGWTPVDARGRIGAAYCATAYGGVASGHRVLGALVLTGMPIVDVEAGCTSGAGERRRLVQHAAGQVAPQGRRGQLDAPVSESSEQDGGGPLVGRAQHPQPQRVAHHPRGPAPARP